MNKDLLLAHAERPRRFNPSFEPTAVGKHLHAACNDEIEIKLLVSDGVIQDIGFTGHGCVLCMASASLLCEYVMKMSVPMVLAMQPEFMANNMLCNYGVETDTARERCVTVPHFALQKALQKTFRK